VKKTKNNQEQDQDEDDEWNEDTQKDTKLPDKEAATDSPFPVTWDERYWYRRTKRMMLKYSTTVKGMIAEANEISESVCHCLLRPPYASLRERERLRIPNTGSASKHDQSQAELREFVRSPRQPNGSRG